MIRLANINDIAEINNLLFQVQNVHAKLRSDLFKSGGKKYSDEEIKNIMENDETPIFVYELDKKVVGYAFCVINNYDNYKSIYIDDLCTSEEYRAKGIGTALFEYVSDYAKSIGCYNVTLNVWIGNDDALEFYKNKDMEVQKITMEKIL